MAIVVVSVLMIAIAPMVVYSTGTRVQARRVELATQAGRTYIDGVKAGAIAAPTATVPMTSTAARTTFTVPVPSNGSLNCSTDGYCQSDPTLYCVNLDDVAGCLSTSLRDMVIQPYRSVTSATDNGNQGYLLGVRVYRADAFKAGVTLVNPPTIQQSTVTNGIGSPSLPVVLMTTEIAPTGDSPRDGLCARLGCQE